MPNAQVIGRSILVLASVVICLAGIKFASSVIVPFLLSLFIAIICNPAIDWLERLKVPRGIAIVAIIAVIVVAFMVLAGVVGSSVNEFRQALPDYEAQLADRFQGATQWLAARDLNISIAAIKEYFDPGIAMAMVTNMLSSFSSVMANLFLILLTVVFMLVEAKSFPKKLHVAFSDPEMKLEKIDKFLSSVNQYMAIKTLVSMATGAVISFILWAMGVDFYMLWGLVAFLLNYVPNIGSMIAAIPAVILTFLQLGPGHAAMVAGSYVAVNMVMGNVIEPRFMGRGLGLSTLVVFLSLIFWGWLLGTVGMLLSVPLTMILKIGLETSAEGRWFAVLLSSQEEALENGN